MHDAILSRLPVDGYVGIVEVHRSVTKHEGEVVLVYVDSLSVVEVHVPVGALNVNNIDFVTVVVEKGV